MPPMTFSFFLFFSLSSFIAIARLSLDRECDPLRSSLVTDMNLVIMWSQTHNQD